MPPAAVEETPNALSSAFRQAARAARPAVVHVGVEVSPRAVRNDDPFRGFPFGDMFGVPEMRSRPSTGAGSGFIISDDGYILTNNHVVANASRVTVTLTDNRQFEAEVVGRDPNTDVAVIKIEASGLPSVRIGNSDVLDVGDWVLALGYPLTLGETVTAGIVSAKGRGIQIMGRNEGADAPLEHFIQTDAAINPGNSGGPLINLSGEVIGINSAIASPTGAYAGYGFAVPIQLAWRVAEDLMEYGAVHRPKLGVSIRDLSPADAEVFGLPAPTGAAVVSEPGEPARSAGVRMGDVIVAVDGDPVVDTSDLMARIALRQPGEEVVLELIRYGDRERARVKLDTFETAPVSRTSIPQESDRDSVGRLGFAARELSPEMASRAGLPDGGVYITGVDPSSGLAPTLRGSRIERVNGREISSMDDLRSAAGSIESGSVVSIVVRPADEAPMLMNYRAR